MKSFKTFIDEGVNDPAIFKAVFLAGGPGSGKSFIVGRTGLPSLGFKVVNSDDAFEFLLTKNNIPMTPDGIFSPKGQEVRGKAKRITDKKQARYLQGRLGLVIDGTGKDVDKIKKARMNLELAGYDTAMIFVNTDEDTALKRNRMRARTLPDDQVSKMWKTIQQNIGEFQTIFGKQNMLVVDNSEGKDYVKETLRAYKDIAKFAKSPPDSSKAKRWISQEKSKAKRS